MATTPKLTQKQKRIVNEQARLIATYRRSIRTFIKDMWGLEPQPVRPEYAHKLEELELASYKTWEELKRGVSAEWYGEKIEGEGGTPDSWRWDSFIKGKHFTWQQNLILMGIEKSAANNAPHKLSTVSGHGVGKSATCSWIILWFLLCYFDAQVPVTAPTSAQMHDVLWKEISVWLNKMPSDYGDLYDWTRDYVRMIYAPDSWFARARTSSKENTEAIAGVHSDHVAIVADEASGIPEQVFETAQGALTSGNVLIILISNGTRPLGYFFDSHHRNREDWQTFRFNCEESPVVDPRYPKNMANQYGLDSEEYAIRVKGKFPKDASMDDSGYLQLMPRNKISIRVEGEDSVGFIGRNILGVDPSGEGKDKATFVLRDQFKAKIVHERITTNPKQIAEDILTLVDRYKLNANDVVVDAFGIGADVAKEVALASAGRYEIYSPLVGNTPKKEEIYNAHFFERHENELQNPEGEVHKWEDLYVNIRAVMYFRTKDWLVAGGELVDVSKENSDFADEVVANRWKRTLQGNKIQMMPKKEMIKLRIKSPNYADALALTFLRDIVSRNTPIERRDEDGVLLLEDNNMAVGEERFSAT